ncbi:MAG: glycosyltransferase family 2 protein [Clostridiales bacterium]|jgi:GT2 family glycosyltransferase|nr:glycosyltransferase family 2 protein [Clostridiales bacterium]
MNIYIIIVNFNFYEFTKQCIDSIIKAGFDLEHIIVVDNNSSNNSAEVLTQCWQNIILIRSRENNGFAAGNNIGIKYALEHNAEAVILLNNDTIIDKNLINELIINSEPNTISVPRMYYFDRPETIWYAGGRIDWLRGNPKHIGVDKIDCRKYSNQIYVDFATGCCMLIPIPVLLKCGLLDESYFMYCEDTDYSLLMHRHGLRIKYVPTAKLWHRVGGTSGSNGALTVYYSNRNRFFFLKKYKFSNVAWIYTLLSRTIKYLCGCIRDDSNKYILKAWLDFRSGVRGKVEL